MYQPWRNNNNRTKTEKKEKKYDTHSLSPPTQTLTWMNNPWNFPSLITWSNNLMTVISLAQMRQYNGCGNVRNDIYSTHTWDLVQVLESASLASWKTPATCIDSIHPNNHPRRNKKSWKKIKLPTNCIVLIWSTYTDSKPKRCTLGIQP